MDTPSLAQHARPCPEHEAAHAALLDAARDALDWLRRFQRHAPQNVRFGGEERLTRKLSAAVRMCSFEIRPCPSCDGGTTHDPEAGPMERPRLVSCPECGGSGKRRVYAYPRPRVGRGG